MDGIFYGATRSAAQGAWGNTLTMTSIAPSRQIYRYSAGCVCRWVPPRQAKPTLEFSLVFTAHMRKHVVPCYDGALLKYVMRTEMNAVLLLRGTFAMHPQLVQACSSIGVQLSVEAARRFQSLGGASVCDTTGTRDASA